MKKILTMLALATFAALFFTSCKSDQDKVQETVSAFLVKQMKNPESFKIISMEIRKDTILFFMTKEILDMTDKVKDAFNKFEYYNDIGYLFAEEKYEAAQKAREAQDLLINTYQLAQKNDSTDIEYVAYVKASGTNPMGGTVSSSHIIIVDLKDPTKILGDFRIDSDFIKQYLTIKTLVERYKFKKNKYGKYETNDLPYFEKFIMDDAN